MANEDMDGNFLGGGSLDHVVQGGEIYLNARQLATLLWYTGSKMGMAALALDDIPSGCAAHMVLTVAEKLDRLRSELLKREAEAMFTAFDNMPEIDLGFADFDD